MEADNKDLPMGFARAMVELYEDHPEFFEKENIDRLAATPAPKLEKTNGSIETLTGDAAQAMYEKMKADIQQLEVVPLENN